METLIEYATRVKDIKLDPYFEFENRWYAINTTEYVTQLLNNTITQYWVKIVFWCDDFNYDRIGDECTDSKKLSSDCRYGYPIWHKFDKEHDAYDFMPLHIVYVLLEACKIIHNKRFGLAYSGLSPANVKHIRAAIKSWITENPNKLERFLENCFVEVP